MNSLRICQSCETKLELYESGENMRENDFGLKTCPNCKSKIPKDAITCNFCGKSTTSEETELASLSNRIGAYLIDTLVIVLLSVIFIAILVPMDSMYNPATELSYNLIVLSICLAISSF